MVGLRPRVLLTLPLLTEINRNKPMYGRHCAKIYWKFLCLFLQILLCNNARGATAFCTSITSTEDGGKVAANGGAARGNSCCPQRCRGATAFCTSITSTEDGGKVAANGSAARGNSCCPQRCRGAAEYRSL